MKIKALNIFFEWVIKIFIVIFIYYIVSVIFNLIPDRDQYGNYYMDKIVGFVLVNVVFIGILMGISAHSLEGLIKDSGEDNHG